MYATERHQHIADTIDRVGRVSVAGLARDFGVTTETIRRDLDTLEQLGRLRRVHGGAVPPGQSALAETSLDERLGRNAAEKDAIARAALALIPPTFRGSVLLDSGSTTGRLAELLVTWSPDENGATLDVSTNSIPLAARLHAAANPHLQLRSLGGAVRGITGAAVGPATADAPQTALISPCIRARSSTLKISPKIVRVIGMMPPAPNPWIARKATSCGIDWATPQRTDPPRNSAAAVRNSGLRP